jgi:hypothetical protein
LKHGVLASGLELQRQRISLASRVGKGEAYFFHSCNATTSCGSSALLLFESGLELRSLPEVGSLAFCFVLAIGESNSMNEKESNLQVLQTLKYCRDKLHGLTSS